jgi:two-component system, NarL family, nitrate/nitrite response regulator NarL
MSKLTEREIEIIALVCLGASNQEIASRLGICIQTVKNHLHNIYRKLGRRRVGVAVWYEQFKNNPTSITPSA